MAKGADIRTVGIAMNNKTILDAFLFRHACKTFDPAKPVSDEDFATILEAGRLSPSSFGQEPWKFLIVQNPALREKLRPVAWGAQGQLATASHFVVILARTGVHMRYDSAYIDRHLREIEQLPPDIVERKRGALEEFQKDDFRLLENDRALWDWSAKQCYLPLANMMTVAAMLGVDSCPIEGFQQDPVTRILAGDFGVNTEEFRPAVMVAFGRRINPQPEKRRTPAEETVAWLR